MFVATLCCAKNRRRESLSNITFKKTRRSTRSNYYYYDGSTNVWMPRVKNKSFGWAANRNQPQHRIKFLVTITHQFAQKDKQINKNLGKNDLIRVSKIE